MLHFVQQLSITASFSREMLYLVQDFELKTNFQLLRSTTY